MSTPIAATSPGRRSRCTDSSGVPQGRRRSLLVILGDSSATPWTPGATVTVMGCYACVVGLALTPEVLRPARGAVGTCKATLRRVRPGSLSIAQAGAVVLQTQRSNSGEYFTKPAPDGSLPGSNS